MIGRRDFLCGAGGTTVALLSQTAIAQTSNRVFRLAHLGNSAVSESGTRDTTLPELARLGFVEGRNLIFEGRIGDPDAMPRLMSELLSRRPDVVIAVGPTAIRAAGAATRDVPIVTFGGDVVEFGLAASYARPGGNVTGVVILANELEVKRLSLLHEAVPDARRVALLLPSSGSMVSEDAMQKAAASMGVEILTFTAASPSDYPAAFAAMRSAGAQALMIGATPEFYRDTAQLAGLAQEAGLGTVGEWAVMAQSGCLIGYGPSREQLRKRIAAQVAEIFKGAAPGSIAIERPSVFELAVNQKTAKSLGITIPMSLLAQADEVIE